MWLDVSHLHGIYRSPLGKLTQRLLLQRVRRNWPDLTGQRGLSIGYGVPYMRHIKDRAERTLATMPESQGVIRWPPNERNLAVLADERKLPFPDNSMDRVLLVHAIEFTEHLRPMLRETWRVLASGGRLLVVAPNRRPLKIRPSSRTRKPDFIMLIGGDPTGITAGVQPEIARSLHAVRQTRIARTSQALMSGPY